MTFIPTTNGALVIVPFVAFSHTWSNHLWFSMADFDTADQVNLANAVLSAYFNALDASFSDEVTYGKPICYDMRTYDGPVMVGTDVAQVGEAVTEFLAPSLAVLLTLRTGKRGRSFRGRIYVSGFTETHITNGKWTSTIITAVEALGAGLVTYPLAQGWTFGVRTGFMDGVARNPAFITQIVGAEVRNDTPGHQRKRDGRS